MSALPQNNGRTTQENRATLEAQFAKDGFVVLPGFFSKEEMPPLIDEIVRAKPRNGVSGLNRGAMTFYSNVYFFSSAIQKIIASPKIIAVMTRIAGPDILVRWDQAVAKAPGAGDFGWHQDNGYSGLHDQYFQLWIALTDMTQDNGGLWLQPGSHKSVLPHTTIQNHRIYTGTPESPVFIGAKAGDVVIFSSMMLHATKPNVTQDTRWAYVAEYMSLDHLDPTIRPPYFVVARNGKASPQFVRFYRGRLNPLNQLRYMGLRSYIAWVHGRHLAGSLWRRLRHR